MGPRAIRRPGMPRTRFQYIIRQATFRPFRCIGHKSVSSAGQLTRRYRSRRELTVAFRRAKVGVMRTLAPVVLLAMVLAWPVSARCQQQSWSLHDPNDYTQEDSHPVRAIASLLSPIGFALEWGIARPWHYVATQTPLAPVLNGGQEEDSWDAYYGNSGSIAEAPMPQPHVAERNSFDAQSFREQNLGSHSAPAAQSAARSYRSAPAAAPAAPPSPQGQAILH